MASLWNKDCLSRVDTGIRNHTDTPLLMDVEFRKDDACICDCIGGRDTENLSLNGIFLIQYDLYVVEAILFLDILVKDQTCFRLAVLKVMNFSHNTN